MGERGREREIERERERDWIREGVGYSKIFLRLYNDRHKFHILRTLSHAEQNLEVTSRNCATILA